MVGVEPTRYCYHGILSPARVGRFFIKIELSTTTAVGNSERVLFMREIILKKDVLEMIYNERVKVLELKNSGELSEEARTYLDEYLCRLYHKIQLMGMMRRN